MKISTMPNGSLLILLCVILSANGQKIKKRHRYKDKDIIHYFRGDAAFAVKWTRLSCHDFGDNQVRLQLFCMTYNIGNFLLRLVLPKSIKDWFSKILAKITS